MESVAETIALDSIPSEPINIEDFNNDDAIATLKITVNGIKTEFTNSKGRKVYKNIGLDSLINVLKDDSEYDSGFLPVYGNRYTAVKRYIKSGDKQILFMEASPQNRSIPYNDGNTNKTYHNVMFPGLLMAIVCRSRRSALEIKDARLFATMGPIIRDTDQLYKFPFGNVWIDKKGSLCWGEMENSRTTSVNSLLQAGSILDEFLSGTMNADLFEGRTSGNKTRLRELLTSLENAQEFSYDKLKKDISFKSLMTLTKNKNVG